MAKVQQTTRSDSFFAGPGEMRDLYRSIDWGATPCGPVACWSPGLRIAVRTCLDAPVPMSVWGVPHLAVIYNDPYAALLGKARHPRALGRSAREVWSDAWPWLGPEVDRMIARGEPAVHPELRLALDRGGATEEAVVNFSLTPIRNDDGRVVAAVNVIVEISGRQHAEEAIRASEVELRESERLAKVGSWKWVVGDGTGWSEGLYRIAGRDLNLPPPTIEELPRLFTAEGWDRLAPAIEHAVRTGEPYELELEMIRADGTRSWAISRGEAVRDPSGNVTMLRGVVADTTDRKRAEQERERLVAVLREADQRKDEFLGMLSHELRNPLAPIRNSLDIVQRATPGSAPDRRARAVIDRQLSQLTHLVDDLLDITRITRGKIRLRRTRVDFVNLVSQTVDDHRSILDDRHVVTNLPDGAMWIVGDPTRLAQMIGNLLHNAAKFTPKGGSITVSLRRSDGRAEVEVVDTGVGIEPNMLLRLFEPFAQAEHTLARTRGGLGLGLALVKGLAEQHGGTVEAASEGRGRGARFTLALPLDEAPAAAPEVQLAAAASAKGLKVLVIEDNVDAADTLATVLDLDGYDVKVSYGARDGISKAREFKPDVLLCDVGLPEMSGYDVARTFHADATLKKVLLVALTGYAGPEDQHAATEAGFARHFPKPPNLRALEDLLATTAARIDRRARAA